MTVLKFGFIPLDPIYPGLGTWGVTASPDGQRVYAAVPSADFIAVIDTRTNVIIDRIRLDSPPFALAMSPDGANLYATTYSNLAVINTSTNLVVANPEVGLSPLGVAATPDGSKIYVTGYNSDSVSVISTKNFKVKSTISLGASGQVVPTGIAVSPNGTEVYIALSAASAIAVLDTTTDSIVATIPVVLGPSSVAFTPDAKKAYAATGGSVSIIDTASRTVTAVIDTNDFVFDVRVGAEGDRAWVTHPYFHLVSTLDTATDTLTNLPISNSTWNVAISDIRFSVDIKPGEFPNSISLNQAKSIQVAILSRAGFSAPDQINVNWLTFGHTGREHSLISCNAKGEDVNHDGLPDLVCQFDTAQSKLQPADTVGIVRAVIFVDGQVTLLTGIDPVTITTN